MNLQSKINVVRSRINQIKESDLFTDSQKKVILKANKEELLGYQFLQATQRLRQVNQSPKQATN